MAPQQRLHILDLPVDVLTLILRPLVTTSETIPLCPCAPQPLNPLSVLLVHPALHAIACPIFYGENVFELEMTGRHGRHVQKLLEAASSTNAKRHWETPDLDVTQDRNSDTEHHRQLLMVSSGLRRIHSLRIRLDRLRGWVHGAVVPRLQDMIVRGTLAHLSVCVCSTGNTIGPSVSITSSVPIDAGVFGRPPMAGLLAVLADPYLRTATLWVSPIHGPTWCEFHAAGRCPLSVAASTGSTSMTAKEDTAGDDRVDGGNGSRWDGAVDGLLEVDWRRIVRTMDPEGRAVAVAWKDDLDARRWL